VSVYFIQSALKLLGHYDGEIDGIAGPGTRSAVRLFQASVDLPLTGVVDAETKMALLKALEKLSVEEGP
jgi:peptidoglycan hydrolase-like protein with peptidoglycan-binding domain